MRRKVEYFFLSSVWLQQAKGSGSFGSFTCDAANYSRFSKRLSMDIGVVIESFGRMAILY
jgi:hypothetical protein